MMKTLLVLAPHPQLAESLRAGLDAQQFRLVERLGVDEAEPLLANNLVDACVLDVEGAQIQGLWAIEKLRRKHPNLPLLVFTGEAGWEWEEEAYLQGVAHLLRKPVRTRLLKSVLDRLWAAPLPTHSPRPAPPATAAPFKTAGPPARPDAGHRAEADRSTFAALEVLRDFSAILTHSLCAEAMLRQFLLQLREIVGVNRAAIFLRPPVDRFGTAPSDTGSRRLRAACALGLPAGLLEHFELSFESGIGGHLFRQGRILRRESADAAADAEIDKEFELLGAQVAVPILDRESLIGVAAFDGRLTGEPLTNAELGLIFHLLEQLGLAIKNIRLHDQLSENHRLMVDIFRQLSNACIVVGRDLHVLHANKAARSHFGRGAKRAGELEFTDLPQLLGSKIYQVLKTGAGIENFKFEPPESPGTLYSVTIIPFQQQGETTPESVLLVAEDRTQAQQLQKLEIEAANLRLLRTMADRLAHEIGNALVPLSAHQQLLGTKFKDPEFLKSLDTAMAETVTRVTRLINQMRFLARDTVFDKQTFPLEPLINEAYQEAQRYQSAKTARLKFDDHQQHLLITGDRAALKHALAETLLNAIQANPADAKIGVSASTDTTAGGRWVSIEVHDNGPGFPPDAAKRAAEAFFTTRNVGLGLGLTVSRKIIETHRGKLEIIDPKTGQPGIVRISLPLEG